MDLLKKREINFQCNEIGKKAKEDVEFHEEYCFVFSSKNQITLWTQHTRKWKLLLHKLYGLRFVLVIKFVFTIVDI